MQRARHRPPCSRCRLLRNQRRQQAGSNCPGVARGSGGRRGKRRPTRVLLSLMAGPLPCSLQACQRRAP